MTKKELKNNKEYQECKKKKNVYSVMGRIGDIIFYPIIFIALICCVAVFVSKSDGKVPTILGVTLVNIRSGSMEAAGFEKDDVVVLVNKDASKLRAGDIVGYYNYFDETCDKGISISNLILLQSYNTKTKTVSDFNQDTFEIYRDNNRNGTRMSKNDLPSNTNLIFHRIIGVYIKNDGTLFYRLQGDSNQAADSYFIAEDYIIGKYVYTPQFIRGAFSFVGTPTGMIAIIVVPLSILLLFILFSIIEQLNRISLERRVLARTIRYDCPESLAANIGIDMELPDKVWFYSTSEEKELEGVAKFLWKYLSFGDKEDQLQYASIKNALNDYETKPDKFWMYFIGLAKNQKQKQKIESVWHDWKVNKAFEENKAKMSRKKKNSVEEVESEEQKALKYKAIKKEVKKAKIQSKAEEKVKKQENKNQKKELKLSVKQNKEKPKKIPNNVLKKQKKIVKSKKK